MLREIFNVNNEFETKVLNITVEDILEKLHSLGAKEHNEVLLRRYVFDMSNESIEWIRLRINGEKTTLTYKSKVRNSTKIGETIEIETEVSDFETTAQILLKVPFQKVFYQENKSQTFEFNDLEFAIVTWPMLPTYLEVESSSEEKVKRGLRLLNLEGQDAGDKDMVELYHEHGIDVHSIKELRFE